MEDPWTWSLRATSCRFASKSFDFVVASHVIEHIPDPMAALLEWARVLETRDPDTSGGNGFLVILSADVRA